MWGGGYIQLVKNYILYTHPYTHTCLWSGTKPLAYMYIYMHAKSLQSCPTLCDPMDSSPPGSSVHGILQLRILEWVAISFSNVCKHAIASVVSDSATVWTAHQAPLSTGFSRQEYWSRLPFSSLYVLTHISCMHVYVHMCVCVCVCVYKYPVHLFLWRTLGNTTFYQENC